MDRKNSVNFDIFVSGAVLRKITKFIYRVNFWIHRKIPGITLSMLFPKIVDFEQKLPQIRDLKILGIQPKYGSLLKNLKSIP